jgi:hypothetical protein
MRTHLYTARLGEGVVFDYSKAPHRGSRAKNQTRLFFRIDPWSPSMMEKTLEWKKHRNYQKNTSTIAGAATSTN